MSKEPTTFEKLRHVYVTYDFKECSNCDMPHDDEGCQNCARCDGCLEYCDETHDAPNGDNWCEGCIECVGESDERMADYNSVR